MLSLLWASAPVLAGATDHPIALVAEAGGGVGVGADTSGGGLVGGRVVLQFRKIGVDLAAREGLFGNDLRTTGEIFAGVRRGIGEEETIIWRLGFAHCHETPIDVFNAAPVGSITGVAEGIDHRSGGQAALSWWSPEIPLVGRRISLGLDLAVSGYPDPLGPPVYVVLTNTVALGLGSTGTRISLSASPEG